MICILGKHLQSEWNILMSSPDHFLLKSENIGQLYGSKLITVSPQIASSWNFSLALMTNDLMIESWDIVNIPAGVLSIIELILSPSRNIMRVCYHSMRILIQLSIQTFPNTKIPWIPQHLHNRFSQKSSKDQSRKVASLAKTTGP